MFFWLLGHQRSDTGMPRAPKLAGPRRGDERRVPGTGALLFALLAGGCSSTPAEQGPAVQSQPELLCRDATSAPAEHYREGDTPIIHGFVVASSGEVGFRPCNSSNTFFIQAPIAVWDALEAGSSADAAGGSTYVRFHGVELECTSEIPEPYAGGIRIADLLSTDSPPPANCN